MANRRCLQTVIHHYSTNPFLQPLKTLVPTLQQTLTLPNPLSPQTPTPNSLHVFSNLTPIFHPQHKPTCHFSSRRSDNEEEEEENGDDEEEEEEEEEGSEEDDDDEGVSAASNSGVKREYTAEEKEEEAAAIGYKVIGPLQRSERVFKPYEPVFAVVQVCFGYNE